MTILANASTLLIRTAQLDAMSLVAAPVINICVIRKQTTRSKRAARCYLRRRAANWFKVSTATENPIAA